MAPEQRRHYRSEPPHGLQVQLRLGRGDTLPGELRDLSGWGAGVALPLQRDPGLETGQRLVLQFLREEDNVFLGALARVSGRSEENGHVRYGFEFTDMRRLHRFLPRALRPHFNRRRSLRVAPPRSSPVEVRIALGDECHAATLHDLGAEGLGVRLPPEVLGEFAEGRRHPVALELPDGKGAMVFGARVVHVASKHAPERAGLALLERRHPAFVRAQKRLQEYSLALQREALQRKAH